MMKIGVTAKGLTQALKYLVEQESRARAFNHIRVLVGSNLVYAFGIEFGKTRSGRLARRAGGAFMLTNALKLIRPEIADIFARAGTAAFDFGMALYKLGLRVQTLAMGETPVKTGSLRRSMHTVREGF
jgi:hypothetical protein